MLSKHYEETLNKVRQGDSKWKVKFSVSLLKVWWCSTPSTFLGVMADWSATWSLRPILRKWDKVLPHHSCKRKIHGCIKKHATYPPHKSEIRVRKKQYRDKTTQALSLKLSQGCSCTSCNYNSGCILILWNNLILSNISAINKWATDHHSCLNGKSYS